VGTSLGLQKWMFGASKGSHEVEEPVLKAAHAWTGRPEHCFATSGRQGGRSRHDFQPQSAVTLPENRSSLG